MHRHLRVQGKSGLGLGYVLGHKIRHFSVVRLFLVTESAGGYDRCTPLEAEFLFL